MVLKIWVEVFSIEKEYWDLGWFSVVGVLGIVKVIKIVLIENVWYIDGIELDGLYKLCDKIFSFNIFVDIDIFGIKVECRVVFFSGLVILIGIFE